MSKAASRPAKRRGGYTRLPGWARLVLAAASGGLGALGQAPYDQPLLLLIALCAAFLMFQQHPRGRDAAVVGWSFGVGYFCTALVWILQPFQIDPDKHAWMAPFALLFMSTGLALFWGGAFWIARRLSAKAWPLLLTWSAAELLRAYVFTGFPWASPAQALVNSAAGQALAWVGPHGMTLWLVSLAWFLTVRTSHPWRGVLRAAQGLTLAGVAASLYLPPLAPAAALTPHTVRLVQPNAEQHLKWHPDFAQSFFQRQLEFTAEQATGAPPTLTLWPETAIPWIYDDAGPALELISEASGGRMVALGLLRRTDRALFNSMAVVGPQKAATQLYDKHHLVPFGEYIPFPQLAERLGLTGLAQVSAIGFGAGPGARMLDFGALGRGLPLICYEAVFAHDVNATPERPGFLIQITNDAWFGRDIGPLQHLAQARMRAIEQGLPLMRAANTGVSAMIDPYGRILDSLPMGEAGFIDAALPQPLAPTLYSRTGDLAVMVLLLAGLFVALMHRTVVR